MPGDSPTPTDPDGGSGESREFKPDARNLSLDGENSSFSPTHATAELAAIEDKLAALFPTRKPRPVAADRKVKSRKTSAASQAKRNKIVELIGQGSTVEEACSHPDVQVQHSTYEYYRRNDDTFRKRVDIARAHRDKTGNKGWTGDFPSFADTFFPQEYPMPGFHIEIARRIETAPPQSVTLINVFPDSGKSTLLEAFVGYTLAVDPNHRFTIASKGLNQARKMCAHIQSRMTNSNRFADYIARFGPFYEPNQEREGRPWTREYFRVARADSDERDPSVQVLGWKGQILGSRVDTMILDDIQTGDNLNLVEDMIDKFRQEYATRLREGRIVIIGNRIATGDFYERLLELDLVTPGQHFDYPAVDHNGESLWPERWPNEMLERQRKLVGEKGWWIKYQQKPQLAGNATFDEDMLEGSKDWTRRVGSKQPGEPCILSIDPGLDPGATAIVAMTYDSSSMKVIDAEKHTDFTQQEQILQLIESFALRYSPQHVVIETVAYQRALERDERLQAMAREYGFMTHAHQTHGNKLDPVMGVAAMAGSFLRSELRIPWGDPVTIARMEPVLTELGAWRPNVPTRLITQDFVMALWFAWLKVLEFRHGMGMKVEGWNRGGMPGFRPHLVSASRTPNAWARSA